MEMIALGFEWGERSWLWRHQAFQSIPPQQAGVALMIIGEVADWDGPHPLCFALDVAMPDTGAWPVELSWDWPRATGAFVLYDTPLIVSSRPVRV
jgi:hypothetical protein